MRFPPKKDKPVTDVPESDDDAALFRAETAEFINAARDRDLRCVRIIHGKGRRQIDQAPRLKQLLARWLPSRPEVLALCSARPQDGGTGAVYVLLKKRP